MSHANVYSQYNETLIDARYQNFLKVATSGGVVQVKYLGEWHDLSLEGLARNIANNKNPAELRVKNPRAPVTKAEALEALELVRQYNGNDEAADIVRTFILESKSK